MLANNFFRGVADDFLSGAIPTRDASFSIKGKDCIVDNAFDKNLESVARQQALDDIRRAARRGGILKEAETKAREQLANLFHQLGFDVVEFRDGGPVINLPGPG